MGFAILRSRDDITLSFSLRDGANRADLRLFGSKHDYYRMAMGVRLDETLGALARADPNVEAAGATRDGKSVAINLRYARPTANVPRGAAIEHPAKKGVEQTASASGTTVSRAPPGTEAEVALPASLPPPVSINPEVTQSEAVPLAAPPPLRDTGSPEEAQIAYGEALRDGGLQALVRFLERFPRSSLAADVRRRADALREEAAYRKALERDDAAGYRAFLSHFPASSHRAEVEARAKFQEERLRRAQADRKARVAGEARRRDAYNEARRLDSAAAYRIFLAAYPEASEAREVKRRLAAIAEDDDAFQGARESEQGLDTYLATYPRGRHVQEAQDALASMKRARMEADYQRALGEGTQEALESFLKEWPRSPKASDILATLRKPREPRQVPPQSPATAPDDGLVLRVRMAASPPVIDGKADDACWESALPLDVPLAGPGEVKTLRLKAAHNGKTLYLLAQWADTSRDALYRPWIWDPTRKTYHQNEQVDDALAISLYRGPPPSDPCMLSGAEQTSDTWLWRAYWSGISGLADDGLLQVTGERVPRADPHPASDEGGQVWIRQEPDNGLPGWSFFIPAEFQGAVIPSYHPYEAQGSRADVRAQATWSAGPGGGGWTVELARAFDTGHGDDTTLLPGRPQPVAFAAFDKSEKARHNTSPLVWIEILER